MKHNLSLLLLFLFSLPAFSQFNCIDGQVWTCNGFVFTDQIDGDISFATNSISQYTCDGDALPDWLGNGLNPNYGQDDIYIFNSIGESGAFNTMEITLTAGALDDLDLIAISSDCNYNCFSSESYSTNTAGTAETVTIEWEDEATIILVVEAYEVLGSGIYDLNFNYYNNFDFCSYFPNDGDIINCESSNTYSSTLIEPQCILTFPTDCPPRMDYHEGEGPYGAYEHVYNFVPEANNGIIDIDLSMTGGMKAFLYQSYSVGFDFTPRVLIGSGTSSISVPYTLEGFDQFTLIIDGQSPNGAYSFTIDYPGCESHDACGDCFTYTDLGNNSCLIDPSLLPVCDGSWYYSPFQGGSTVSTGLGSNNIIQFPSSGDYILCYDWDCGDLTGPNVSEITEAESVHPDFGTCCIVVRVGQSCTEPPVAHLTGSFVSGSNIGHINQLNASGSQNTDYYSFEFGDGTLQYGTPNIVQHDYPLEPIDLTTCVVASNECGMSKYCMSFNSYGDNNAFNCNLPFNPYTPPQIIPFQQDNNISFSGLSQFSGAEYSFDPGDGSGELPWGANSSYSYTDDEGIYLCCVRVTYSCYSVCFCYTVRPSGYNCNSDPWPLECNTNGNLAWNDNTSVNGHSGLSTLSDVVDNHNGCVGKDDGCDDSNILAPNVSFGRNEIVYEIINPAENDFGNIALDLIVNESNLDLDMFVYSSCDGAGNFSGCIASSVRNNYSPSNNRDGILLEGVPAFEKYYVVIDGQSNAPTMNEGAFTISYTCGDICRKEQESISCGQTIQSTTVGALNEASYYCNCENESPLGPAGNYGPEKVYRFDLTETTNVAINLDVLSNNIDLELYLLDNCNVSFCNRNSRNPVGEDESINKTLSAGTYYIIVEGFRGDAGPFSLSVSGCEVNPVPADDCELVSSVSFSTYNNGDFLPSDDNTGNWSYGFCYSEDPNDNSLDAAIEQLNGNNRLVLNSGNYFYSDVLYSYSTETEGLLKLDWDMTLQYVNGELYGGKVKLMESNPLLDFSEHLEIVFGHNANGNFAELWHRTFNLLGGANTKLADLNKIKNYQGFNQTPTFNIDFDQDLDNGIFTMSIDGQDVYTGYFNFLDEAILESKVINFATDDEQDYMEIDNIRVFTCEDCSITYDDDCGNLFPLFINQTNDNNVAITLGYENINQESIEGFQVTDELSGEVIELSSLSYNNCIPGRSYKFCVIYLDEDGCLSACCYRITIPVNCQFFSPYYTGDDETISYNFATQNLPNGWEVDGWHVDGTFSGSGSNINVTYPNPTTSYVCCLLYNPFAGQYVLCCQKICTQIAVDCNNVSAAYDSNEGTYNLSVSGASEIISWNIDIPTNLPNNGLISDPSNFRPSEFGISPGQAITVSVRYKDSQGCIKVCCIVITPPVPQDAVIIDFEDVCGAVGSTVNIPVRLYNFQDVGSVGFEIFSADPDKVRLEGIVNEGNQFSSIAFNTVNDKIILGWDEPLGGTTSVSDGTRMFDIEVTILSDFDNPVLVFGGQLEVFSTQVLDATINQGTVCVSESFSVSGIIRNESQERMEGFDVRLYDDGFLATITNQNGEYLFNQVNGQSVEVEAYKNDNIKQGITNADVALIRRHFLQISTLPSDYKMIAGDINKSGSITNADVALARRIFLEVITDEIPNNTSWRFVPEDTDISANPLNTNLEDRIILSGAGSPVDDANFVAIKVGDVNNSVNVIQKNEVAMRSAPLRFIIRDTMINNGNQVIIPLYVEDFELVSLFGFEMLWDESLMSLQSIEGINLPEFTSQNYNIQPGRAILGWDEPTGGAYTKADGPLMNLTFEVAEDAMGTTNITFDNAEILDINFSEIEHEFAIGDIEIGTSAMSEVEDLGVSVYPNPFQNQLNIKVDNPAVESLQLLDINGKLIWQTDKIEQGNTRIGKDLDLSRGVYFLRISDGEREVYRKVIRM